MEGRVYSGALWTEQRVCGSTGRGPYRRGLAPSLSLPFWVVLHSRAATAEALAAYCRGGRTQVKCVPERLKPLRDATYLSLSLRGPEELGSVGPALSELSTEKPAPKLVI